jgi:hypothetical protein
LGGLFVVVASQFDGATQDFSVIANAIGIVVGVTIASANTQGVEVQTAVILICGHAVVIAGHGVCATRDFEFIANPILVLIVHTLPIAIEVLLRVDAVARVVRGVFVVVAC